MSTDYTTLGLGAAVGLALGLGVGAVTSNPDLGQLQARFAETVESATGNAGETVSGAVEAVSGKIDALSASVDEQLAAADSAMQERIGALEAEIAELAGSVETGMTEGAEARAAMREALAATDETVSASLAEMKETLSALGDRLAALESRVGQAATPAPDPASPPEPASATEAAPAEPPVSGTPAGRTEMLADGALRVFVSAVDAADGTARVAINGVSTQMLRVGSPASVSANGQTCTVTLDAIERGHAQMTGRCGSEG